MNNDFRLDGFGVKESGVEKKYNYTLRMFFKDYESLLKFRNYKLLKEKEKDWNFSKAFSEGLNLLEENYDIDRNMENTNFKTGRRTTKNELEIKETSVQISLAEKKFINDFIFYKRFKEEKVEYTKMEFVQDLIKMITQKYSGKF